MELVILESPYGADSEEEISENVRYAQRCVSHSLRLGEAPIASHLLYTQPGILDDSISEEREHGIKAGLAWARVALRMVVYADKGISPGMIAAMHEAKQVGLYIDIRFLDA